ncbi:hypothetical protein [Ottowia thiooxydans]|uniref:hypothetical protein n=1 Tax=Ottowia thiooxydans TaxID=219182 RepID=UPI00049221C7|nr:hypothetical protein [Ottowia thiooxydans]
MDKKIGIYLIIAASVFSAGCAKRVVAKVEPQATQWSRHSLEIKVEPKVIQRVNEYYEVIAEPKCMTSGCNAFMLTIKNKTAKNLEVNWNKTLYVFGAQASGGFMFEGVVYKDRNSPKSSDVIFGNGHLIKLIYPNDLVKYYGGRYVARWDHEDMPFGENGIFLTVNVDGKEVTEKIVTSISISQPKN